MTSGDRAHSNHPPGNSRPPGNRCLRIAQIVRSLDVGGIETFLANLVPALSTRGVACEIFCIEYGGRTADLLAKAGVPVHVVGLKPVTGIRALYGLAAALRARPAFDLVHGHGRLAAKTARVAALQVGHLRTVVQLHAVRDRMTWRQRSFERALAPTTDAYVVVSRAVLEAEMRWWRRPTERFHVIPNGIPLERFALAADERRRAREAVRAELQIPAGAFCAGTSARLCADKDLPTLLRGLAAWFALRPQAHFLLAGSGPDEAALRALAGRLALPAERLHWAGFRPDMPAVLAALDAFTITSATESFCLSLLEAFQAGLPAVTTWVGGIRDYVVPEETALCLEVGAADLLAAALVRLEDDSALRDRLAAEARRVAQRFDIDAVADRFANLYRQIVLNAFNV